MWHKYCVQFYDGTVIIAARRNSSAVLAVKILSMYSSVIRVHGDKTKESMTDIQIPHERAIMFWQWKWLVEDVSFHLKIRLKLTHAPLQKRRGRQLVLRRKNWRESSIIINGMSTTSFQKSSRWSVCVNPKSPRAPVNVDLPVLRIQLNVYQKVCNLNHCTFIHSFIRIIFVRKLSVYLI